MKRSIFGLILSLNASLLFSGEVFFEKGKTDWKIFVSPQAKPEELYAACELQQTLLKISGAHFEIICTEEKPARHTIVLGDLSNPVVREKARDWKISSGEREQIGIYTSDNCLYLVGNQPRAVLYAVYTFLQKYLGVRWFWPGTSGEFIPGKEYWSLPELSYHYQPFFLYRGFHLCGDWRQVESFKEWMARNFINIYRHASSPKEKKFGFYSLASSHNARLPQSLFQEHPEYFAEVAGKRYAENICFSHPETERLVAEGLADYIRKHPYIEILSIYPADNQTYCRCEKCRQTDVSTCWFQFYNRVSLRLKKEFPHLKFATLAYQGYRSVPACSVENASMVEYCPYDRCHVHLFNSPDCKFNQDTLKAIENWKKTGQRIGIYGYEFDIFRKNFRFVPFFSLLEDGIRTYKNLELVSVITEISLSPKTGPETSVLNVQNRLPLYLYARLLWNPEEKMSAVVQDWCQTIFSPASEEMYQYYLSLDKAWSCLLEHRTILADAAGTAQFFLTDSLREKAETLLIAATEKLSRWSDSQKEKAQAALQREKVLLRQWDSLVQFKQQLPDFFLPFLSQGSEIKETFCQRKLICSSKKEDYSAEAKIAWNTEAILLEAVCHKLKSSPVKTKRDDNIDSEESLEIILSPGLAGPVWHLIVNPLGTVQDYLVFNQKRQDHWNPDWQAVTFREADFWSVRINIPFSSLGETVSPGDLWEMKLIRRTGYTGEELSFPAGEKKGLVFFSGKNLPERNLLWWSGRPEREKEREKNLVLEFFHSGWQMHLVTTGEELLSLLPQSQVFWFRHPQGTNKVPEEFWQKYLVPAISEGAVAVFSSYWDIPLEKYFNQADFKVTSCTIKNLPLPARRSVFLAPGDWISIPNNLLPDLKNKITPCYGFLPEKPDAWTILATAPRDEKETFFYILMRKYGKGMIFLCGTDIPVSPVKLLENFVAYYQKQTASER